MHWCLGRLLAGRHGARHAQRMPALPASLTSRSRSVSLVPAFNSSRRMEGSDMNQVAAHCQCSSTRQKPASRSNAACCSALRRHPSSPAPSSAATAPGQPLTVGDAAHRAVLPYNQRSQVVHLHPFSQPQLRHAARAIRGRRQRQQLAGLGRLRPVAVSWVSWMKRIAIHRLLVGPAGLHRALQQHAKRIAWLLQCGRVCMRDGRLPSAAAQWGPLPCLLACPIAASQLPSALLGFRGRSRQAARSPAACCSRERSAVCGLQPIAIATWRQPDTAQASAALI